MFNFSEKTLILPVVITWCIVFDLAVTSLLNGCKYLAIFHFINVIQRCLDNARPM